MEVIFVSLLVVKVYSLYLWISTVWFFLLRTLSCILELSKKYTISIGAYIRKSSSVIGIRKWLWKSQTTYNLLEYQRRFTESTENRKSIWKWRDTKAELKTGSCSCKKNCAVGKQNGRLQLLECAKLIANTEQLLIVLHLLVF